VGAATTSRVTSGPQVFVDNYFVSVALQFGPVLGVALVAAVGYALWRLCRRTADRPVSVLFVALLAGLACSFLVIEAWEYPGAMMCLGLFVAHGLRLKAVPSDHAETGEQLTGVWVPAAPKDGEAPISWSAIRRDAGEPSPGGSPVVLPRSQGNEPRQTTDVAPDARASTEPGKA
jgi:hypothetical protein